MVWHSTLTVEQATAIANVQKVCLKVILGTEYSGYDEALSSCGLDKLDTRREAICLRFGLKSLTHTLHSKLFPVNKHVLTSSESSHNKEHFQVN